MSVDQWIKVVCDIVPSSILQGEKNNCNNIIQYSIAHICSCITK